tara:strand:- start:1099 stop:2172 length:1074 start_codon:yes stop_codon:yes gene_type:complete
MSSLKDDNVKLQVISLDATGYKQAQIENETGLPQSTISDFLCKRTYVKWWSEFEGVKTVDITFESMEPRLPDPVDPKRECEVVVGKPALSKEQIKQYAPKILTLDIETAPLRATVWGIWQQNVPVSRINTDWYCLSWAAKWFGSDDVIYEDKRETWNTEDDYNLIQGMWKLLDEADMVITQNGKKFDIKRLNTRFLMHGMKPPSNFKHVDTLQEAKRWFNFSSNKLEFMTDKLCKVYKKLKHGAYAGNTLWDACLAGDMKAWDEMEEYNIYDVLSLEELYTIMRPYMKLHPNLNVFYDDNKLRCNCGGEEFSHNGYHYSNLSKFDRFSCDSCGSEVRGRVNLFSKEKRASLRMNVVG